MKFEPIKDDDDQEVTSYSSQAQKPAKRVSALRMKEESPDNSTQPEKKPKQAPPAETGSHKPPVAKGAASVDIQKPKKLLNGARTDNGAGEKTGEDEDAMPSPHPEAIPVPLASSAQLAQSPSRPIQVKDKITSLRVRKSTRDRIDTAVRLKDESFDMVLNKALDLLEANSLI